MMRELFQYVDKQTFVHRVNVFSKLIAVIMVTWGVMISYDFIKLLLLMISLLAICLSIGGLQRLRFYTKLIILMALAIVPSQALFYWRFYLGEAEATLWIIHPDELLKVPILGPLLFMVTGGKGIAFCMEGLIHGTLVLLKLGITWMLGALVIMTTKPGDIVRALSSIGVPRGLIVSAITTLRFIPLTMEEAFITSYCLRMRGVKRTSYTYARLMLRNAIYNAVARSQVMTLALELKGFGTGGTGGRRNIVFKAHDLGFIMVALSVLLLLIMS
ncbi:MAG: hypothetical protein DRN15_05770 [Thermoprotei archaeon]|nr:MAG: hypothetical protein DRN15_05770 [Thermoprotei archaeon]RLF24798.1 MAG: hypothetical protein DRM97_03000 [Thermoprotei archaeon]